MVYPMQKCWSWFMSSLCAQIGTFLVLGFSIASLFALSILWRDHRKTVRLSFQVRGVRRSIWKSSLFIEILSDNWQKVFCMVDVFHMVLLARYVMTLHFLLGERKPRPEAEFQTVWFNMSQFGKIQSPFFFSLPKNISLLLNFSCLGQVNWTP